MLFRNTNNSALKSELVILLKPLSSRTKKAGSKTCWIRVSASTRWSAAAASDSSGGGNR